MAPPTSGPMAMAKPAMPPQAPSATARRSGLTAADRMVRLKGVRIAPPMPWMARAMISSLEVDDRAAAARACREDRDADDEQPLATKSIAQRGAG